MSKVGKWLAGRGWIARIMPAPFCRTPAASPLSQPSIFFGGAHHHCGLTRGEISQMYQPNFCAECGAQIVRERWRWWTSRRFCPACAGGLGRRARFARPLLAACGALLALGFIAGHMVGRFASSAPSLLVIERQSQPSFVGTLPAGGGAPSEKKAATQGGSLSSLNSGANDAIGMSPEDPNHVVSLCGARTKKGTPCSRRVRGTGRCWQHRGRAAMLPPEKLVVPDG
ncbi:MAG: hypothetical protein H0T45_06420 [Pyrinomonadaceae bacterium]|nr:hypothetical protein [Pyrinomonadaceae bacterium]